MPQLEPALRTLEFAVTTHCAHADVALKKREAPPQQKFLVVIRSLDYPEVRSTNSLQEVTDAGAGL
ncbi:MAG: hypothetical protein OSB09_10560 [Planctomycetota bacterium]|nr:hypothetical protein [Planctomycetota bacterium]